MMNSSLFMIVLTTGFSLLLLSAFIFLLSKNSLEKESSKINSIEAGFENLSSSYFTMSSPFFFLAILFVMFDLEILLLLPIFLGKTFNLYWIGIFLFFLISLLIEWLFSGLKWNF